jgi:uncharacterized protein (DUF924 family)
VRIASCDLLDGCLEVYNARHGEPLTGHHGIIAAMDSSKVLEFWFARGEDWFRKSDAFDAEVRGFLQTYEAMASGGQDWLQKPDTCLARIIVLDQFPRNMFRGTTRAFATDALALEAARIALAKHFDARYSREEKIFAYLPFEHSEALADQQLACELMKPLGGEQYRYAIAHRDIIARFGRFPHRNAILGRASTPEEIEFLKQPGSSF